jgi:hypothetical protein
MDEPRERHHFDFWLGSWKVFDPDGRLVGTNRISALFGGLALMEEWEGNGAVSGRSLNSWDAGRDAWHQTWMDSSGSTLLLDGGLRDGSMVMEGSAPSGAKDEPWDRHRITWTPSESGTEVRQLWETSGDDGQTWSVAFDGRYRRA